MAPPTSDSEGNPYDDEHNGAQGDSAAKHEDGPVCAVFRNGLPAIYRRLTFIPPRPASLVAVRRRSARELNLVRTALDNVCRRLECIYDEKKSRPGMRAGAIEHLTQRVATLENMFLGQGLLWQEIWSHLSQSSTRHDGLTIPGSRDSLQSRTALGEAAKMDEAQNQSSSDELLIGDDSEVCLPDDLIDSVTEIYFTRIHPWIPMLHESRFRDSMKIPSERTRLRMIFYAITSVCARLCSDPRLSDAQTRSALSTKCRRTVMLAAMESFSVENLQALVICAFDIIGNGKGPSAWSIVGSMARTVECLQLSVERDDEQLLPANFQVLIKRAAFLPPSQDWTEAEGRRRVFWNVFLMDRFCSMATGWNLSLKSEEIKRRLPCEGKLWKRAEPLAMPTPYLGVADRSLEAGDTPLSASLGEQSMESLGGFAYCIEATESLSLVSSFFLQQVVDLASVQETQRWMLRFKKLDLRLIQWKLFLPERWKVACALNEDGIMDPNLTLAHITHNTAVVLLHQCIAYPPPCWQATPLKLPSVSSAETCLAAAREVAIMAHNFLQGSDFLTNPQFSFCLFICGRLFLAHSKYYKIEIPVSFESLIESLGEISRRWNGPHAVSEQDPAQNLASKFAQRLLQAEQQGGTILDIRQSAFPGDAAQESIPATPTTRSGPLPQPFPSQPIHEQMTFPGEQQACPDGISLAYPPLPTAFQVPNSMMADPTHHFDFNAWQQMPDELQTAVQPGLSQVDAFQSLLDHSFLHSDRISVYSDLQPLNIPEGTN
ncbi:fungal-specific transcription factor domain-containing protein [Xylariaceae sp. FL1272]|nr:fungal-specific transcription factor domain-containing protein [Xylariaceae sp. FL1272]